MIQNEEPSFKKVIIEEQNRNSCQEHYKFKFEVVCSGDSGIYLRVLPHFE